MLLKMFLAKKKKKERERERERESQQISENSKI
jgi:hypothetical protein